MAKKKRRNSFDLKHLKNLNKSVKEVSDLYTEAQNELIKIGLLSSHLSKGEEGYSFKDYPELDKLVNARLKTLRSDIVTVIENGELAAWELSNAKNDAMVKSLAAMTHVDISNFAGCMGRNLDALAAFQSRKINGMGLSSNVWNMCKTFKKEMELALSVGMKDGASAAEMSKDVRHLLKYPDKLFRRVKDKETGKLKLSKAAKAFHPGRGVYRSSYKNALRLTATESNMAYRTADHERWQQMSFVTGIEIETSNRHKKELVTDICDDLAGVYPKNFKFVGWHPFCRCFATPKLASVDDFEAYLRDKNADEYTPKDGEVVKEVPKKFNDWLEANAERIAGANSLPYFLRDNEWAWSKDILTNNSKETSTAVSKTETKTAKKENNTEDWHERLARKRAALQERFKKETKADAESAIYEAHKEKIDKWIEEEMTSMPLTQQEKKILACNWIEIEKELGTVKKKCMTYDEANNKRENPHFNEGLVYKVNCQSCVPTHILRRWGFDIEARPNVNNATFERFEKLGVGSLSLFKGVDGNAFKNIKKIKLGADAEKEIAEFKIKRSKFIKEENIRHDRERLKAFHESDAKIEEYIKKKNYDNVDFELNKEMKAFIRLKKLEQALSAENGIYEIECTWTFSGDGHVYCAEVVKGKVTFFDPQVGRIIEGEELLEKYIKYSKDDIFYYRLDNKPIKPFVIKAFAKLK